jgi:hypothetical protein
LTAWRRHRGVIFCPQEVPENFLALTYADRQHLPRDATAPGSLRWRKFVDGHQGNASRPAAVIAAVGVA